LKTALVIGSNSDIAKSAIELLQADHKIIPIDRTIVDLSREAAYQELQFIIGSAEPDVVINCAGVFGDNTSDYDLTFDVNLKSNWAVIKHYIDNPPAKPVKFIMLGSSVYKQGRRNFILYASSKAALFSMFQGASEFVSENLKLGLINPVHVHTKMVAHRPHPNPDICLEPIDVAREIINLCGMSESRYIDMDYKGKA
jgi:NAD(P)-dependent dehydrogenase (short-subunit alcohol dehydrogenase family)